MFNLQSSNYAFQHKDKYNPNLDLNFNHCHNNLELHYIIKGSGTFTIESATTRVQGCNLIIIPPHVYHHLEVDDPTKYERIILNFPKDMFPLITYKDIYDKPQVLNLASHHEIIDLFDKLVSIEKYSSKTDDFENLVHLIVQEIILILQNTTFDNGISKSVNELASKIICYIDEHIYEPLTVQDIAKALYVSKSHLQNTFLASMKIGIKAYIILKKMDKAHMLLQEGKRATDVATLMGYSTYSCFYKSYVKVFGHMPRSTR